MILQKMLGRRQQKESFTILSRGLPTNLITLLFNLSLLLLPPVMGACLRFQEIKKILFPKSKHDPTLLSGVCKRKERVKL